MVGEHIVIGLEQYSQKPIYYYDPNGSPTTGGVDSQFTGFVPDLIDTFAAEMGFTYEFRALPSTGIEYALQGPMGALFPEMMRSSFPAPGGWEVPPARRGLVQGRGAGPRLAEGG